MVLALRSQGITEFSANPGEIGFIVILAAVFAVAASLWPAWKASRLEVLDAIAHD